MDSSIAVGKLLFPCLLAVQSSRPSSEAEGRFARARMAADLRYTTADIDFLYTHFLEPGPDRPRLDDLHIRLVNPSKADVLAAIVQAGRWLETHRNHPDWDGGGLYFNYT